jgi:hypothetical protein
MRTSLPENHQTAPTAVLKRQNSLSERRLPPDKAIKPPSRRSRTR